MVWHKEIRARERERGIERGREVQSKSSYKHSLEQPGLFHNTRIIHLHSTQTVRRGHDLIVVRAGILQVGDLGLDPVHQLLDDFLLLSLTIIIGNFVLCFFDLLSGNFHLLLDVVQIADLSLDVFSSLLDFLGLFLLIGEKMVRMEQRADKLRWDSRDEVGISKSVCTQKSEQSKWI